MKTLNHRFKFRAWDNLCGCMYEAWPLEHMVMLHVLLEDMDDDLKQKCQNINGKYWYATSGKDLTFMQFTGFQDKHGKDIYEGDIIHTNNGVRRMVTYSKHSVFPCIIVNPKHPGQVGDAWGIDWAVENDQSCEVVGNIYENPELLENENKL
jgi:uncharacterized phage protein (TIGR01671 family)